MRNIVVLLFMVMLLVGCVQQSAYYQSSPRFVDKPAPAPIPTDLPPLSEKWQQQVMDQNKDGFKDPDSLKWRFIGEPFPCSMRMWTFYDYNYRPLQNGHCGYVGINGKNSYGGYTGEQLYYYLINGDSYSTVVRHDPRGGIYYVTNPPMDK
ncbi:hypothetical protein [Nitratidesulfovibrio sp. 1201_IL3209]|uniref:hypothetical protein n=1 Tax=Nitratidesulfovibrio sp. 1201_IL3209 TaxID=3084053 RepID=UPI002FD93EC9